MVKFNGHHDPLAHLPQTQKLKILPRYPAKNRPFSLLLRAQGPKGAPPPGPIEARYAGEQQSDFFQFPSVSHHPQGPDAFPKIPRDSPSAKKHAPQFPIFTQAKARQTTPPFELCKTKPRPPRHATRTHTTLQSPRAGAKRSQKPGIKKCHTQPANSATPSRPL